MQLCGSLIILWHCLSLELEWKLTFSSVTSLHGKYTRKQWTVTDFIFWDSKTIANGDCTHEIKTLAPWKKKKKSYDKPGQHIKNKDITLPTKVHLVKAMVSSSHVGMWELDHKEGWGLKHWCFRTLVLEKTLESPLDNKKIQPVNPKGNQSWIFIGRTEAEAEAHMMRRVNSLEKTLMLGKTESKRRRGWQRMRW